VLSMMSPMYRVVPRRRRRLVMVLGLLERWDRSTGQTSHHQAMVGMGSGSSLLSKGRSAHVRSAVLVSPGVTPRLT
jgi:hypothetical protein